MRGLYTGDFIALSFGDITGSVIRGDRKCLYRTAEVMEGYPEGLSCNRK